LLGAELVGPATITIDRVDALERGAAGSLTFIRSGKYLKDWSSSKASAAVVSKDVPLGDALTEASEAMREPRALLIVPDADLAIVRVLDVFSARPVQPKPGVHPLAFVDASATVSPLACIGPSCTVGAGAVIGDHTTLVANVHVGQHAKIGARCTLHPQVSVLERCCIGNDTVLHSGVVIGADGFGYRPRADGRGLVKIPHIGDVVVGDEVEIGANSCVDRAKFGSTVIGNGTKIDNLVQIGHGCRIGRSCVICGHVGISGSVVVGDGVVIGGKVGIADNIEIGSGVKIAAFSGVMNNVPAGATWMGQPAGPAGEWRRTYATLRKLGKRTTERDDT
jgi:UDP-3-O-[3-hydroxymyristoyl] glucosamine N-acyltransferase